jgi:hypothetical protein
MMNLNKRNISMILLFLGMIALAIGLSTDNDLFSYAAIAFVSISMILSRRNPRKRKQ